MGSLSIGGVIGSNQAMSHIRSKLNSTSTAGGKVMSELRFKYPDLNFTVGTTAFGTKGKGNNVTIAPNILREMESNPDKRTEYEEIIKKCDKFSKESILGGVTKMVSQGFLIDNEGELSGWAVTKNNSGTQSRLISKLNKESSDGWFSAIAVNLRAKDKSAWQIKFDG